MVSRKIFISESFSANSGFDWKAQQPRDEAQGIWYLRTCSSHSSIGLPGNIHMTANARQLWIAMEMRTNFLCSSSSYSESSSSFSIKLSRHLTSIQHNFRARNAPCWTVLWSHVLASFYVWGYLSGTYNPCTEPCTYPLTLGCQLGSTYLMLEYTVKL